MKYTDLMKPEDITIANLWTVFAGHVLDPSAPAIQRTEMRKAFYSGFIECFAIFRDLSADLPDEEAFKHLDRLQNEAALFFDKMMKEHPTEHPEGPMCPECSWRGMHKSSCSRGRGTDL